MVVIGSQVFFTPVMGHDTPYTGFLRIFVPEGSLGYLGKNSCGCCGNGGCKDPRIILEFAEGILVSANAFAGGSRKALFYSSGGLELSDLVGAPVQYLPNTLSLDSESECPCNPSERWSANGPTTFDDLRAGATRRNPFEELLAARIATTRLEGEAQDLRQSNENLLLIKNILTNDLNARILEVEALTEELRLCRLQSPPASTPAVTDGAGSSEGPSQLEALLERAYGDC